MPEKIKLTRPSQDKRVKAFVKGSEQFSKLPAKQRQGAGARTRELFGSDEEKEEAFMSKARGRAREAGRDLDKDADRAWEMRASVRKRK